MLEVPRVPWKRSNGDPRLCSIFSTHPCLLWPAVVRSFMSLRTGQCLSVWGGMAVPLPPNCSTPPHSCPSPRRPQQRPTCSHAQDQESRGGIGSVQGAISWCFQKDSNRACAVQQRHQSARYESHQAPFCCWLIQFGQFTAVLSCSALWVVCIHGVVPVQGASR